MPLLFDSHCHINDTAFDADRDAVLERMRAAGLVGALVLGCDRPEVEPVLALVKSHPGFLYGAWALHPEYEDAVETSVDEIVSICSQPEFVAVGETGLDYHWCHGDLSWQKRRFRMHIEAAKALSKPIVVHARESEADALAILEQEHAGDVGFVLHCFAGSKETALRAVEIGGLVSFTGVVTFKNAEALRDVVRALPAESMMVETDCPYMTPAPYRGKRNEPAYVEHVARQIAAVKGLDYEEFAALSTRSSRRFFHLNGECK